MKIIKTRTYHAQFEYRLEFRWKDDPNAGFTFECDERGYVDSSRLPEPARANLWRCFTDPAIERVGIVRRTWEIREPAIGVCDVCGRKVELGGFTNACDCGADYNQSGQRLAPRECWGEETGESLGEILAIDNDRPARSRLVKTEVK